MTTTLISDPSRKEDRRNHLVSFQKRLDRYTPAIVDNSAKPLKNAPYGLGPLNGGRGNAITKEAMRVEEIADGIPKMYRASSKGTPVTSIVKNL